MEITKKYMDGTAIEDYSQDFFEIKMSVEEFIKLESVLFWGKLKGIKDARELHENLDKANNNRKTEWVK